MDRGAKAAIRFSRPLRLASTVVNWPVRLDLAAHHVRATRTWCPSTRARSASGLIGVARIRMIVVLPAPYAV
jgi:hypothetical protein